VREIKWTLFQVISLALLIAAFAAGCIVLAWWVSNHPFPD
jgi:hypothetical protein